MAPKFAKSALYKDVPGQYEQEVLDNYAEMLDLLGSPDVLLSDIPDFLDRMNVPTCFTSDIQQCIQWFYDSGCGEVTKESANWTVAEQLLNHLTISATYGGHFEVSDIVDIDKLIKFCNRLLRFRDHFVVIKQAWRLFVEASGHENVDITTYRLSMKDLRLVKSYLQLDDISDSILIDMLGCGGTTVEGSRFNYSFLPQGLAVNIKDFAEIMGQLGELD